MSEAVELIAQINASWRVVVVCGGKWGPRAWLVEHLIDGAWRGHIAATRSPAMLREMVQAWAGHIEADAAAILAALPARAHTRYGASVVKGKRAQAAETRAAAAAALKRVRVEAPAAAETPAAEARPVPASPATTRKRSAAGTTAAAFLRWREQNQNTLGRD